MIFGLRAIDSRSSTTRPNIVTPPCRCSKNEKRPRVVIITQGTLPTVAAVAGADKEGKVELSEYPVHKIEEAEINDTNGAGDAFAGGFCAGVVEGKSLEEETTFLNDAKRQDLTVRFKKAADGIYVEAKRSAIGGMTQIPLFVYGLIIFLGWNEFMTGKLFGRPLFSRAGRRLGWPLARVIGVSCRHGA